jgi:hypothetical protein
MASLGRGENPGSDILLFCLGVYGGPWTYLAALVSRRTTASIAGSTVAFWQRGDRGQGVSGGDAV